MVECPTCGTEYSEHGVKLHHSRTHGESYYTAIIRNEYGDAERFLRKQLYDEMEPMQSVSDKVGCSVDALKSVAEDCDVETPDQSEARELVWERKSESERKDIVEPAHEETRKRVERGEHNFQDPDFERVQPTEFWEYAEGYNHARFRTNFNGYEAWRTHHNGETEYVKVHRLLAVAKYGFDEVADMHVHHTKPIPWLNTYANITLETPEDHARTHYQEREIDEQGRFK